MCYSLTGFKLLWGNIRRKKKLQSLKGYDRRTDRSVKKYWKNILKHNMISV